jgi:hypothetical protein
MLINSQSPLSFFTSFFGMNVLEWRGGNHAHTIAVWSGSISVSVIISALFMAYSKQMWVYANAATTLLYTPFVTFYDYFIHRPTLFLIRTASKFTRKKSAIRPGVQFTTDAIVAVAMPGPWQQSISSGDEKGAVEISPMLNDNLKPGFFRRIRKSKHSKNHTSIA